MFVVGFFCLFALIYLLTFRKIQWWAEANYPTQFCIARQLPKAVSDLEVNPNAASIRINTITSDAIGVV